MNRTNSNNLVIPFLGDRGYLQGSSILEAFAADIDQKRDILFKINNLIDCNQVRLVPFDVSESPSERLSVTLTWSELQNDQTQRKGLGLVSDQTAGLVERVPFDESDITNAIKFDDTTATMRFTDGYSFIRCAVSTNKALLLRLLTPPDPGRWLFTRLNLDYWPKKWESMTIEYQRNLRFQLVTSSIQIDGTRVGTMHFSWKSI
jgi:hypothetical protein